MNTNNIIIIHNTNRLHNIPAAESTSGSNIVQLWRGTSEIVFEYCGGEDDENEYRKISQAIGFLHANAAHRRPIIISGSTPLEYYTKKYRNRDDYDHIIKLGGYEFFIAWNDVSQGAISDLVEGIEAILTRLSYRNRSKND